MESEEAQEVKVNEVYRCAYTEIVERHKLIPNPKNPNTHPQKQIEILAKIIKYQGQRKAIVVSKRSGFMTKGHGTLQAMELLGWERFAVDYQDYDDEQQEYADMKADNEIQAYSKLDKKKDKKNLKELDMIEFDIELMGIEDVIKDVQKTIDDVGENTKDIGKSKGKILHTCPKCQHQFTTGKQE